MNKYFIMDTKNDFRIIEANNIMEAMYDFYCFINGSDELVETTIKSAKDMETAIKLHDRFTEYDNKIKLIVDTEYAAYYID